jgi:hypothetical protein
MKAVTAEELQTHGANLLSQVYINHLMTGNISKEVRHIDDFTLLI